MLRIGVLGLVLAACGAGESTSPEPSGFYRIDSNVGSECAIDQPVLSPSAYLELSPFMAGAAVAECPNPPGECVAIHMLPTEISGGWLGSYAGAQTFENGRICALSYRETTVTIDGAQLVLETTAYGETLGAIDCTPAAATARGTAMPCTAHHVIEATAIAERPAAR